MATPKIIKAQGVGCSRGLMSYHTKILPFQGFSNFMWDSSISKPFRGLAIPLRFLIRAAWSLLLLSGDLKEFLCFPGLSRDNGRKTTLSQKWQAPKFGFSGFKRWRSMKEETLAIGTSLQRMVIHRKRKGWKCWNHSVLGEQQQKPKKTSC